MGCGSSCTEAAVKSNKTESKDELKKDGQISIHAAILIQKWYRRSQARLEAKRRTSWKIFQSMEYAGEQNQLKLYNFFNDLVSSVEQKRDPDLPKCSSSQNLYNVGDATSDEEKEFIRQTDASDIFVESTYDGARISFPLTTSQLEDLIECSKNSKILHAKYLIQILHETRDLLKRQPTISRTGPSSTKDVTVCGDLHGNLGDLLIIFYKNGLPAVNNGYVFNGDFVDRGPCSVEVAAILFCCFILYPQSVFINRGNHEDHIMNLRYGFIKEVLSKYKNHATKIVKLFSDVFSWLPLATVISQQIFVAHGGISDAINIKLINNLERHKFLSVLRSPSADAEAQMNRKDRLEWKYVLDVLWSDPKNMKGCKPNTFRGGGSYWGPDENLSLIIRSHECKPDGYEYTHGEKVLTLFSASNYYEIGSNRGAYVKLDSTLKPRIVQYMFVAENTDVLTMRNREQNVNDTALRELRQQICANRVELLAAFCKMDPEDKGTVSTAQWCEVMESQLEMNLPWRSLLRSVASQNESGDVVYKTTFDTYRIKNMYEEAQEPSSITEALYKHKDILETIFRAIDKDNSGTITYQEFEEACSIMAKHSKLSIPTDGLREMAVAMDRNGDNVIDFNEFLEAFRLVDEFGKNRQSHTNAA